MSGRTSSTLPSFKTFDHFCVNGLSAVQSAVTKLALGPGMTSLRVLENLPTNLSVLSLVKGLSAVGSAVTKTTVYA